MSEQRELFPLGLDRAQFARLAALSERASDHEAAELLRTAESHLERVREAHHFNRMVNIRLAEAIVDRFYKIVEHWSRHSANAHTWLAATMLYFSAADDAEPDFTSPIGFEDDAEVLNACLKLAQLDELLVNPEDYDDV